jgi:hypothetical protein
MQMRANVCEFWRPEWQAGGERGWVEDFWEVIEDAIKPTESLGAENIQSRNCRISKDELLK